MPIPEEQGTDDDAAKYFNVTVQFTDECMPLCAIRVYDSHSSIC